MLHYMCNVHSKRVLCCKLIHLQMITLQRNTPAIEEKGGQRSLQGINCRQQIQDVIIPQRLAGMQVQATDRLASTQLPLSAASLS